MKLKSITPNLMVENVNATLTFYVNQLGFKILDTNPESGEFEWGYVMLDGVGLMFQAIDSLKKEYVQLNSHQPGGGFTLYIRIENILEYYDQVSDKVEVIKPINKTFYGTTEFAIQDLNGYILTFSE